MKLEHFISRLPGGDLWIFGYGSLMWSPGFGYQERWLGRVHGFHRALCILPTRHPGNPRPPGLVMGLCAGGSCWGMVFRVAAKNVRRTLTRLWEREMLRRVYEPRLVPVRIRGSKCVHALAFIADPDHPAYVHELDLHGRARLVAQ